MSDDKKNVTMYDSIMAMGDMYVELKNKGVDPENILDLIRIPFMFATVPEKPDAAIQAVAPQERN